MRKPVLLPVLLCICLLGGCAPAAPVAEAPPAITQAPIPSPVIASDGRYAWQEPGARPLSVWAAYWDTDEVLSELMPLSENLGALCYFEAYYDDAGRPALPDNLLALYTEVEAAYPDNLWESYLTFVNDAQKADGTFALKSTALLERLLRDTQSMELCIADMLSLALSGGFDGIEVDFEALRKAPALWEPYTEFLGRLYRRTQQAGLKLRVVLESHSGYEAYAFPQGPHYVLMCYNLYGGHSGPGPKADPAFVREAAARAGALGSCGFALASGGYDWDASGSAQQLTEADALEIFGTHTTRAFTRDAQSGALSFRYKGSDGWHTVWYADVRTLERWAAAVRQSGYTQLCYWRLGGNASGFPVQ